MTEKQKEEFLNITGQVYDEIHKEGKFLTKYPYNNKEWRYSPFNVYFKYLEKYKLLCIQISNRMTNCKSYTINEYGENTNDNRFITYLKSGDMLLNISDK